MARTDQPHKLTFVAFVEKSHEHPNHLTLDYDRPETIAAWNGSKSKIPIWCREHQVFFVQQAANHMNGQGCPQCGATRYRAKRVLKTPVDDFRRVHGDRYDYSRVIYVNTKTKVEIICSKHGSFLQSPNQHLLGQGCPHCFRGEVGDQRTTEYVETFAERAVKIHSGAYAIIKMPTHSHDTVILHCPKHGEFEQKAFSHLDGHGCWSCGQRAQVDQREVAAFIESLGVTIEHENRKVLGGLHIDIWCPEKKIGVEYHGSHWHTEDRIGDRHREKYDRAVAANIRLIQLFDFEWKERRPAVENRLRAAFSGGASIGARDCGVSKIKFPRQFLDIYHTQGAGSYTQSAYGLSIKDELVAVLTAGSARFGHEGWEVHRYASKGRVTGGFSRLFSAFVREHNPARVTSFCDLRWGNGRMYEQSGFVLSHVTVPDYWYVDLRGQRISRYAVQGRPKGISEKQWVTDNGYRKALGVGHQCWIWTPAPT